MARVFVSFAIEDRDLRTLLVGQRKNARNEIEFADYSVQQPWSSSWKTNCRLRIKQCRGVIGIVTRNTSNAEGQLWELECARTEGRATLLIHGRSAPDQRLDRLPRALDGRRIVNWTETNVVNFLNSLS